MLIIFMIYVGFSMDMDAWYWWWAIPLALFDSGTAINGSDK